MLWINHEALKPRDKKSVQFLCYNPVLTLCILILVFEQYIPVLKNVILDLCGIILGCKGVAPKFILLTKK